MKDTMQRYAVIGHPVSHSLSPAIHAYFARQTGIELDYALLSCDIPDFESAVDRFFRDGGCGLNVTLPFKERAFALAQKCSPRAREGGAANTLWMEAGVLCADNTDGEGLVRDLARVCVIPGADILVLGAGGAARGIMGALLAEAPGSILVVNRTEARAISLQQQFPTIRCQVGNQVSGSPDIVINATSASLAGEVPDFAGLRSKPFCYDLAYSRDSKTPFVRLARTLGLQASDGLGMLVEQAAAAFRIWHGVSPDTAGLCDHLRQKICQSAGSGGNL